MSGVSDDSGEASESDSGCASSEVSSRVPSSIGSEESGLGVKSECSDSGCS